MEKQGAARQLRSRHNIRVIPEERGEKAAIKLCNFSNHLGVTVGCGFGTAFTSNS